jgi:hypothetical protein
MINYFKPIAYDYSLVFIFIFKLCVLLRYYLQLYRAREIY